MRFIKNDRFCSFCAGFFCKGSLQSSLKRLEHQWVVPKTNHKAGKFSTNALSEFLARNLRPRKVLGINRDIKGLSRVKHKESVRKNSILQFRDLKSAFETQTKDHRVNHKGSQIGLVSSLHLLGTKKCQRFLSLLHEIKVEFDLPRIAEKSAPKGT